MLQTNLSARERLREIFKSDEERGISPELRQVINMGNEKYHDLFYEPWKANVKPFKIVGNIYYVGNTMVSIHLIDTGDGLIVYDTGFQHTMPLLMKSILDLGFDLNDIKYVMLTHGHFDHYGSAAWIRGLYNAKICMGAEELGRLDVPEFGTIPRDDYSLDTFEPDILLRTGDEISLGNTTLKVYEIPGHSAGAIASFMDTVENGQKLRVCFYSDLGCALIGAESLERNNLPPELRKIRERSFELMAHEHADVVLNGHPHVGRYFEKLAEREANPAGGNTFIRPADWEELYRKEMQSYEDLLLREAEG